MNDKCGLNFAGESKKSMGSRCQESEKYKKWLSFLISIGIFYRTSQNNLNVKQFTAYKE
jgi:hypothetical protein